MGYIDGVLRITSERTAMAVEWCGRSTWTTSEAFAVQTESYFIQLLTSVTSRSSECAVVGDERQAEGLHGDGAA